MNQDRIHIIPILSTQKLLAKKLPRNISRRTADSETYRGRSVAGGEGGAGIGVFEDRDGLVVKNRHHIRHMRGKYTMKEEIVKQMEINHPCKGPFVCDVCTGYLGCSLPPKQK